MISMRRYAVKNGHAPYAIPGIFVVGCPRSGTTIVQRALAGHPGATSFPETGYFRQLGGNRSWTRVAERGFVRPVQVSRAVSRLERILGDDLLDGSLDNFRTWKTRDAAAFLREQLTHITASRGARFWVEKTPKQYQTAEVIRRFMAPCVIVHVIRNGRDVLGSIRDRAMKYPERFSQQFSPEFGVRHWNKAVSAAWRQRNKENVFIVQYESFVEDPERILARLLREIGESYDESMLDSHPRHRITTEMEDWKAGVGQPIARPEAKFDRLFEEDEKTWISRRLDLKRFERVSTLAV